MDDKTEITPDEVKAIIENWEKTRSLLLGDHLGFALASRTDWDDQLDRFARFADYLEDLAGEIKAEIGHIDDKIERFLRD